MTRVLSLAAVLTATALSVRADGPGLSLRIADEAAPAGSIVQIKVEVTEPKPISTGRGKIKTRGVVAVEGIALMNEGQDTYGLAMVDGDELSFTVVSPSSVFGTPADYPILGVAGVVANASGGTRFPLTLDPAGIAFHDPSGAVYPAEYADGTLTVMPGAVSIGDVNPGSAVVEAGGVVHIYGANFTTNTRIDLDEVDIAQQRFINSNRIDVVLAQRARMHGMRIRARNDDKNGGVKSECEYFSYERTSAAATSNHAIFSKVVPLFAPAAYTTATVDLPAQQRTNRKHRAARPSRGSGAPAANATPLGIALQNLETSNASVSIELLDAGGNVYAVNTVLVGREQYLVRELGEVFGIVAPPSSLRIRSNVPVQILGLTADPIAGTATPLPPH